MSLSSSSPSSSTPRFRVGAWPSRSSGAAFPIDLPPVVSIVGLGESAHFVEELNDVRADVVRRLQGSRHVTHLALEVGSDEAPAIQAWLDHRESRPLEDVVGPLTHALYGTFLALLRESLDPHEHPAILGVDLPNSLTLEPSLAPLASILARLDPDATGLVDRARSLARPVTGGSAAASASSWMGLDEAAQDALTVSLSRLRGRIDALGAVAEGTGDEAEWVRAGQLAEAAVTTDLMVRAMADLFSGGGLSADTTLRERFIARRLMGAVDELGEGDVIVYVAHDNHIQKSPVVFDGVVAAFPVGQLLAQRLGPRYWSLAVSHLDDEVPEMVVPASTDVGFAVERTTAAPLASGGIEAAVGDAAGDLWLVQPIQDDDATTSIRSQSAVAEIPLSAFDATLVTRDATTDPAVRHLIDVDADREDAPDDSR